MSIITPGKGPGGKGPKKGLGTIVQTTEKEGTSVLLEGDEITDEITNEIENSKTPKENLNINGDDILSLKEKLVIPEITEIEPTGKVGENAKEDEKNGHPMTIYFKDYSVQEKNNKKIVEHSHLNTEEIEFRKNIERFLEDMIGKDVFGLGKIKDYHIFTEGVMSVVAKIIIKDGKEYIFKSCNDFPGMVDHKVHIEAKALDIRRDIGVKTPKIYKTDIMQFNGQEFPYSIMEFVKSTRIMNKDNEQEFLKEIGMAIGKISQVQGKGFGRLKKIDGKTAIGENNTMEEYYTAFEKSSIKKLKEKGIIGEKEQEQFHKAIQIVKKEFEGGLKPSLNHEDLRLANLILTKPITIFDPNLKIDHPLMDLAATQLHVLLGKNMVGDKETLIKTLREGYEKTSGRKINQNIFNACLVIRIISKICIGMEYDKRQNTIAKAMEILKNIDLGD